MTSLTQHPSDDLRFLSAEACKALQDRIIGMQSKQGSSLLRINSRWTGNLRWARNRVISGGDVQSTRVELGRIIFSGGQWTATNRLEDGALQEMVNRAEANTSLQALSPDTYHDPDPRIHSHTTPKIWFDDTYALGADGRGDIASKLLRLARDTSFFSAAYLEVGAVARSVRNTANLLRYYPYTVAQLSITVRDPKARGSGWAGVDYNEWGRIDPEKLYNIALDKCIRSMDPVAVEPGRYTAILEPQAVCDLWSPIMDGWTIDRGTTEGGMGPFALRRGFSKIGLRVVDERLTVGADPMDPDLGFAPFDWDGEPYRAVNWIENGVLKELPYNRMYAVSQMGHDRALPNSLAYRISGGTTSIEEMIETTRRGILVTRIGNIRVLDASSMLMSGNTRDGLWLVENGKISKSVKNFRIVDSPLFVLNNVVQLGVPQRTFRPLAPAICPPVKSNDFSFTALMDAV